MPQHARTEVRPPSRLLLLAFSQIARRRLRRAFRAVRMTGGDRLSGQVTGPLIVSVNHPSWWDPLVCLALARALLPGRTHYAPISAASLVHYPLFARMGMFPVEQNSARGAVQFLRGAELVLARGGVLWMTPQGEFTDVRVRPTALKAGLGALVHRLRQVTVVPVALEYTFWNARLPEALVAVGTPIAIAAGVPRSSSDWSATLAQQLEGVQNELAVLALQRNPALFRTVLEGGRGTAGFYGAWERLRARGDGGLPFDEPAESDAP